MIRRCVRLKIPNSNGISLIASVELASVIVITKIHVSTLLKVDMILVHNFSRLGTSSSIYLYSRHPFARMNMLEIVNSKYKVDISVV